MSQDPDAIITAYQAKLDELVTAVESADWATAHVKLLSARAIRAKLLDSEVVDNGSQLKSFDDLLKQMSDLIGQAESSASKHSGESRFAYARNRTGASQR